MSILAIWLAILACVSCGRERSPSTFAEVAARTTLIQLKHPPDRVYPEGVGIARFHLRYDPGVFSAMASAKPAGRPPNAPADFRILMWENTHDYRVFDYEHTTGSILFGKEWLRVPEDLRKRFQKAIDDSLKVRPLDPASK